MNAATWPTAAGLAAALAIVLTACGHKPPPPPPPPRPPPPSMAACPPAPAAPPALPAITTADHLADLAAQLERARRAEHWRGEACARLARDLAEYCDCAAP